MNKDNNPMQDNFYAEFDDMKNVGNANPRRTKLEPNVYKRRRFTALAVVLAALVLVSWGTTLFLNRFVLRGVPAASSLPAGVANGAPAASGVEAADWNFIGPVEQTINLTELITPDYRMISLPNNGIVNVSYFNSVTFIGDSVSQGLSIYKTGLTDTSATVCAYKGASPKAIYDGNLLHNPAGERVSPMQEIVASAPDNVYILFGANAMVLYPEDDDFIAQFAEMLVQLRASLHPNVAYYVQTITPVTLDNDRGFDNARIQRLNDRLAKMAYENGVYFIDLQEVLADESGVLKEEYAGGDGFHLSPLAYEVWIDYLITHTAYHPRNPYLPGSIYGEPI